MNPSSETRIDPIRLMNLAARIALAAGAVASQGRRVGISSVATKSSPTDLVTEWDVLAETTIRDHICSLRPGDGIVAEEGDAVSSSTGITWYVDPIDGTTNFAYGLPAYAVSIAAVDSNGPLAGAIHSPDGRELFVAARGHGAWANGRRLRCSSPSDTSLALVATGFAYDKALRAEQMHLVARNAENIRDIRRNGAAALDLCFVAAGRVDVYFERNLRPWDMAAGTLIAQEAGATVTDLSGQSFSWHEISGSVGPVDVLACAPSIHSEFIRLFS